MKDSTKKVALGTAVAGLAGFITGVLTAPKSGKETRQDIKDMTTRSVAEAEKQLKRIHTQFNETLNDAQERLNSLRGHDKANLSDVVDASKSAKEKVRDILSSIHEGQVKDKDLGKAVKEAQKALDHLKTFLKK